MALTRFLSGSFLEAPRPDGEIPAQLDREVRLVYTGKFKSIDGDVEVGDKEIDLLVATHNSMVEKLKRLAGSAEVPVRMHPPLQLDHSTSARDTVGRLIGTVKPGPYTTSDGQEVKALYGMVRVLGRENVEKVLDGRYGNVSIGADFATGKISELTITPFPAAEEASLLAAGNAENEGEKKMDLAQYKKGLKHHLEGLAHHMGKHLEGDELKAHLEGLESMRKHLEVGPATDKMGDGAMESLKKHLEVASKHAEGLKGKKMAAEHIDGMKHHLEGLKHHLEVGPATEKMGVGPATEHMKHLEEIQKHLAGAVADEGVPAEDHGKQMAALREGITKLSAGQANLIAKSKRTQLSSRLSRLKSSAKITPAEMKKIDLAKLASESEATIDAVFHSYENREPVIFTGMLGTTKADNLAQVSKKARMSRLESEMRQNMPLKKAEMDSNAKRMAQSPGENEVNIHVDAVPGGEHDTAMAEIHKLMDEGKIPEAKEKLKHLLDGMKQHLAGEPAGEESHKEMSELADEVKKMQTQIDSIKKLAGL